MPCASLGIVRRSRTGENSNVNFAANTTGEAPPTCCAGKWSGRPGVLSFRRRASDSMSTSFRLYVDELSTRCRRSKPTRGTRRTPATTARDGMSPDRHLGRLYCGGRESAEGYLVLALRREASVGGWICKLCRVPISEIAPSSRVSLWSPN